MKKTVLAFTLAFTFMAGMAQINKANMDLSVKPGENFWQYAVGGWLKASTSRTTTASMTLSWSMPASTFPKAPTDKK